MDRDLELQLVDRLRRCDAEAFEAVYEAFNARLFNFLARLSNSRDVAEDLLEETWLRLVSHAPRLRPDTNLGAWLFTVARNLHVSYRRSRLLEDAGSAEAMRQRVSRADHVRSASRACSGSNRSAVAQSGGLPPLAPGGGWLRLSSRFSVRPTSSTSWPSRSGRCL